jgi:PII-like signaling protein
MVIEIVDTEEKIQSFVAQIESMVGGGLITVERVQAIFYKGRGESAE